MKTFKTAYCSILFGIVLLTGLQAMSQEYIVPKAARTFEKTTPFILKPIAFQEWYAGIDYGGTGINVFIPITDEAQNVTLQEVYFRNLKGKLVKKGDKYVAILKNPSPYYTFKKAKKPADYPFTLSDNECVISYVEDGQIKFHRISRLNEYAGTYYENGPPSLDINTSSSELATIDAEGN